MVGSFPELSSTSLSARSIFQWIKQSELSKDEPYGYELGGMPRQGG